MSSRTRNSRSQEQELFVPQEEEGSTDIGSTVSDSEGHHVIPSRPEVRKRRKVASDNVPLLDLSDTEVSSQDEVIILGSDEEELDKSQKRKSMNDMLQESMLHNNSAGSFSNVKCPICFDQIDKAVVTPCGHLFCADCIYEAIPNSNVKTVNRGNCPLCRKVISLKDLIHLQMRKA